MKYYVRLNTFWGDLVCKKNLKKHRLYYKNQVPIYDDDDDDVGGGDGRVGGVGAAAGGGGAVVDADEQRWWRWIVWHHKNDVAPADDI